MHEHLQALALDKSQEARGILLGRLAECVFADRRASDAEIVIFVDIAHRLLNTASVMSRASLAQSVCENDAAPRDLILRLAGDVILVAEPILSRSPVLQESDLLVLAETLSNAHLQAIATRKVVTLRITNALVRRGDIAVHRTIAENARARISQESILKLVDEAEWDEDLCRILTLRGDLPQVEAERLGTIVVHRLKLRLGRRAPIVDSVTFEPEPIQAEKSRRGKLPLTEMIRSVRAKSLSLDEAIVTLARADRYNELAGLIAAISHLDEFAVLKVLVRADCNGIIVVLRSLGVSPETWNEVAKFRMRRLRLSQTQFRLEREDYLKMTVESAIKLVSQFDNRRLSAGRPR